jgi:hypothetical protein
MSVTRPPRHTIAPFYSLARAAWVPYAVTWDSEAGEMRSVEGPREFDIYREAMEASRFLVGAASLVAR